MARPGGGGDRPGVRASGDSVRLDVFYQVAVTGEEAAKLAASGDPGTSMAGRLLLGRVADDRPEKRTPVGAATIGDAGAVCTVAEPDGLVTEPLPVRVCLVGQDTRGQTVVDRRSRPGEADLGGRVAGPAVDVALGVDADRYRRLFLDVACGGEV